jgi:hypothetical protein
MSTPRSPSDNAALVLIAFFTLAVLVLAWLLANLLGAIYEIWSIIQGGW